MAVTRILGRKAAALAVAIASTQGHHQAASSGWLPDLVQSEGIVLETYKDTTGKPTYCIGETTNIDFNKEYTPEECVELAIERVENDFIKPISRCTKSWRTLSQTTKDSLIEFSFNVGTGNYCSSSVRKYLDSGRGADACDRMLLWNKERVLGVLKPSKGLTERRKREAHKCRDGFYKVA